MNDQMEPINEEEVEEKEGKSWIDLIYQKNGMKKPGRRRKSG